jgi:hypothetical protein
MRRPIRGFNAMEKKNIHILNGNAKAIKQNRMM